MVSVQDQFRVPEPAELRSLDLKVMGAIYREGVRHLRYFKETQANFKYPEKRIKTFDTIYYEQVLPIIKPILIEQGWKGKM